MSRLSLEKMEFFAYHGCFKEENIIGNPYLVDLVLDLDTKEAESTDHLGDALNYVEVYQCVKKQMMINSCLIEHVASRILDEVLDSFDKIDRVEIKLKKMNPPIGEKLECVAISMQRTRRGK